jgi:hypothetical protein
LPAGAEGSLVAPGGLELRGMSSTSMTRPASEYVAFAASSGAVQMLFFTGAMRLDRVAEPAKIE